MISLAAFGIHVQFVDEGPEGWRAALKLAGDVDKPLGIGEGLLAGWPKRKPGIAPARLPEAS